MLEAARLYRLWKRQQPAEGGEVVDEEVDADSGEESAIAIEEAEEAASNAIRAYLTAMPPFEFQGLLATLLKAMGYYALSIAPPGPDQGVDVIASTDPLGTTTPRIKVQVKRHVDDRIALDGLRAVMAVVGDQDVGIFISAGGFTSEAQR